MKQELISADKFEVKRNDFTNYKDPKFKLRNGKMAKHSEMLEYVRTRKTSNREVHSDGFLAISSVARECSCGGCAIASDGYICPRCGNQL